MRAYTSLAGHILGSHPQINGYFEMHHSYDDASSLNRQLALYLENEELKPNSRFLFDKLLHNDYCLRPERLGLSEMKVLVCLREPEQTIKSIVSLFSKKEIDDLYASPVASARYYIERVSALADYCRAHGQRYYYFDSALLPSAPDLLLPEMSRWLALDSPLKDRYDIFSGTGEAGKGDSSGVIRSGRINDRVSDYSSIDVPENQLVTARQIYQECRRQIIEHAAESVTD